MSLPTLSDITAVDPVMTNMLRGYKQDASRFIASQLFPVVPVDDKSGTYYIFDKKYWFTDQMQERAPGQPYPRADFAATSTTYDTKQWALAVPIADEIRKANQAPMDLELAAIEFLGQKSLIRREVAFVADFIATSVWANTDDNTTTNWSDFTSGDPVADILKASRTISNGTGTKPNTIAVGAIVHEALINHPDIIDRVKYVQMATVTAMEGSMAAMFGLDRYIAAAATFSNTNEAAAFSATAIFDDDALICFVNSGPAIMKPSAGYTFAWGDGGGNGIIQNWRDGENDADLIKNKEQWDQKVVATDLGYVFLTVV